MNNQQLEQECDDVTAILMTLRGPDIRRALRLIERLKSSIERLEKLDAEAATYVESVIIMRTDFTGEEPYVGWHGLGLALNEALDERDRLRKV